MNYLLNHFKLSENIYKIWCLVICIVVIDTYIEFFLGKNSLGFGGSHGLRLVSFFKDEPIVGAYLSGFLFIVIGYLFDTFYQKSPSYKILIFFIIVIFILCVLLTGERSNTLKVVFGVLLFIYLNKNLNFKIKFYFTIILFSLSILVITNSFHLKARYGKQLFSQLTNTEQRSNFFENNIYINLYKAGFEVFKNNPIFGVGNKNYRIETTKNHQKYTHLKIVSNHPHQIYLELLAEHGIVGTTILLVLLFALIFKNIKIIILSRNSIQLGAFVYLIVNFLPILPSGSFFNDFNATLFWINFSVMYASNPKTNIFNKN